MSKWPLLVFAAAAAITGALLHLRSAPRPASARLAPATVTVTRRDIGVFAKATGVIKPCVGAEVRVGSRLSGVVKALHVRVGSAVAKGQLLAELDDRDLIARRDEASANLARARAELDYARSDLQRKRDLGASRVISPSDLDLAERSCAVAEQQVAVARAVLAFAEAQLADTRIVAPIGGVVASVATQEGETVAASFAAPTFVTLIDLSRLEVWAYVDETDIGRVQAGQKALFSVDTYAGEQFEGRVTAIYPKAEIRDNVVNYVTVVEFAPPENRILRPEMTTSVCLALALRENVPCLPAAAIRTEGGQSCVLLRRAETFVRQAITTGAHDDQYWEITDGVRAGDVVAAGTMNSEGEPQHD